MFDLQKMIVSNSTKTRAIKQIETTPMTSWLEATAEIRDHRDTITTF